ncbi:MAG: Poly(3-hydroxyalkanoate) depolymerase [uncultured Gemmatimonadetes bacterium]|uniref:Poly(3-hydroxyalkanoate) depolymerase n=1 Tax=uncultured Gemmatimonadota bacterium TaxID=203437 RepID=A0A6J4MQX6_9BACT|nr:MAG: Poly(3-hydroxyalkanoate) depolymerase [uncultured Gemmatimonadota bacterium]
MKALAVHLLAAASLLLQVLPTAAHAQARSLVHDGEKRRYIVYTPSSYPSDSTRRYPVVLNFHGGGMTMAEQMLYTGMNQVADAEGFIVVYPQGVQQDWNVGFGTSYGEGTDDVGFIEAVLDQLQREYRVDRGRIYATGLSRGGFFCQRLAAELSHRIAAVASVGGPLPVPVVERQAPRGALFPVGVMLVHGTADLVVAYGGKPGAYLSAPDSYQYWARRNGVFDAGAAAPRIDAELADGTSATLRQARRGPVSVALVTIEDGGHTWAGADPFNVGLSIGRTPQDLDVNAVIWQFLARHSR